MPSTIKAHGKGEAGRKDDATVAMILDIAAEQEYLALVHVFPLVSIRDNAHLDQAIAVIADTPEHINLWQMSHEKTGEMMTLQQKYKLPFTKFRHYKAWDGVAQWRHLSKVDVTKPHPFKEGVMGDCLLFYIVDDDQLQVPKDDRGLKLLREQVSTWEKVPIKITDSGMTEEKPSKINDDHCDCIKCILASGFGPGMTKLTLEEEFAESVPEQFKPKENMTANEVMARQIYLQKRMQEMD